MIEFNTMLCIYIYTHQISVYQVTSPKSGDLELSAKANHPMEPYLGSFRGLAGWHLPPASSKCAYNTDRKSSYTSMSILM